MKFINATFLSISMLIILIGCSNEISEKTDNSSNDNISIIPPELPNKPKDSKGANVNNPAWCWGYNYRMANLFKQIEIINALERGRDDTQNKYDKGDPKSINFAANVIVGNAQASIDISKLDPNSDNDWLFDKIKFCTNTLMRYSESTVDVTSIIKDYFINDEKCRGSSDESVQVKTCSKRDEIATYLKELNWCFGKDTDEGQFKYEWHACTEGSLRN